MPEPGLIRPRLRLLRPETGSAHRAALKTKITERSATAAETRDPEPKSHRKASTWPAYSAPQNTPTTQQPKTTHPPKTTHRPAGKTLPRRRRARRVRRARRAKTKTTKRPNRSRQHLSSRRKLSHLRAILPATISDRRSPRSY